MTREDTQSYRWLAWVVVAVIVGALVYYLSPILTPFLVAAILAYICDPLVDWLERRGVSRTLGTLLVMTGLAALFSVLIIILIPLFVEQAQGLTERLPSYLEAVRSKLVPWLESMGISVPTTSAEIQQTVTDNLPASQDIMSTLL
ncbi:MAG TPA: AI-2E family transporter, partial [Burkholderiales bacterium]|nr:AI-2E family transporter [Burkholderiales bacterium]